MDEFVKNLMLYPEYIAKYALENSNTGAEAEQMINAKLKELAYRADNHHIIGVFERSLSVLKKEIYSKLI